MMNDMHCQFNPAHKLRPITGLYVMNVKTGQVKENRTSTAM